MNSRLIELAMQANDQTGNEFDLNYKPLEVFLKTYADAIVRECARIANEKEEGFSAYDPDVSVHWYITNHFQVEDK